MTLAEKLRRVSEVWLELARIDLEGEVDDPEVVLQQPLEKITLCGARKFTHETWLSFHLGSGDVFIVHMLHDSPNQMFLA